MSVVMTVSSREYQAARACRGATARHRMQPASAMRRGCNHACRRAAAGAPPVPSLLFIDPPEMSGREEVDRLGRGGRIDLFRLEAEQHPPRDDLALERGIVQLARDDSAPRHLTARSDGEL